MYPPLQPFTLTLVAVGAAVVVGLAVRPLRWFRPGGAALLWAFGVLVAWGYAWPGLAAFLAAFLIAALLRRLPGATSDREWTFGDVVGYALPVSLGVPISYLASDPGPGFGVFFGALCFVGADTCATEIGVRYGGPPRSLPTFRRLTSGESGGVTLKGLGAGFLGGVVTGLVGFVVPTAIAGESWGPGFDAIVGVFFGLIGLAGSLLDSVLGALLRSRGRAAAHLVSGLASGALVYGIVALS